MRADAIVSYRTAPQGPQPYTEKCARSRSSRAAKLKAAAMSDNTVQSRSFAHGDTLFVDRGNAGADTELMAPRTQLVGDKDLYLGNAEAQIGRRIGDDQFELFVVCHPAEALLQQFSQLAPDFIAIHDLGTDASTRLLTAVAAASSRKVQKLIVRRQGYGVPLATLRFVELPLQPGRMLRVYTTQVDGDTQSREQLARVLLAHSRLAVIMVGELPPHVLASGLAPLRQSLLSGPWPNRQLLFVPMASAPSLPTQAAALAGNSGVAVRTTPQVSRPGEAWSFISGSWNRLNADGADAGTPKPPPAPRDDAAMAPTEPMALPPAPYAAAYAPTRPLDLQPMPRPGAAASASLSPQTAETELWAGYVKRCSTIPAVVHCCVFDIIQQRPLAHDGAPRMADRLAAKGAMLHAAMVDTSQVLGLGTPQPDAVITLSHHYLLIRPMPGHSQVALHLVLQRERGNIGQTRAELHKIDQALLK